MLSILEQLQGVTRSATRPVIPQRKTAFQAGTAHGMLAHQIDAIILDRLQKHPGALPEEIFQAIGPSPLTLTSTIESLRRLCADRKAIMAQRKKQDRGRYWPIEMREEARAYSQLIVPGSKEDLILGLLASGDSYSTSEIARLTGVHIWSVLKVCKWLVGRGRITDEGSKPGKGPARYWRRKEV